jgi:uncharacterized membrane protein
MSKFQHSVVIRRPVDEVFAFAANYENDPQWRAEVRSRRYSTPPPVGVGSQCDEVSRVAGRRLETTTEVMEYKENERVVSRSISGPTPIVTRRSFEPVEGGTRFTYALDVDESGVALFRLLRPLLQRWYQRTLEGYVERMKQIVEAGGPASMAG